MTLINVRSAARLTGKDRSTIIRAIEEGRLSATRDDRRRYLIDPAELQRVYGSLRTPDRRIDEPTDETQHTTSGDAMRAAALAREVELLREMLERERRGFEEERTFLRGMLERQAEQVRLLTDQREREPARSPSLWARLFRINA
jgi:excisionase family DNA binding protein